MQEIYGIENKVPIEAKSSGANPPSSQSARVRSLSVALGRDAEVVPRCSAEWCIPVARAGWRELARPERDGHGHGVRDLHERAARHAHRALPTSLPLRLMCRESQVRASRYGLDVIALLRSDYIAAVDGTFAGTWRLTVQYAARHFARCSKFARFARDPLRMQSTLNVRFVHRCVFGWMLRR